MLYNQASILGLGATLAKSYGGLQVSVQRLATGQRVRMAADDAAGLGHATDIMTDLRSTQAAIRNTTEAISLVDTMDMAASTVVDTLQRMRELAVQGASGHYGIEQRSFINEEFQGLRQEIDRIARESRFNNLQLTDGTLATLGVQAGIHGDTNSRITVTLTDLTTGSLGLDGANFVVSDENNARSSLTVLDSALGSVSSGRAQLGAVVRRLEAALSNSHTYGMSLREAESRIIDADFAHEAANLARYQIQAQASAAMLAQGRRLGDGIFRLLEG